MILSPTENFVCRSQVVHGELYDYSDSVYINSKTKLKVSCKLHGVWLVVPSSHLNGTGCPVCKGDKIRASKQKPLSEWIEDFTKVHGGVYDYSLAEQPKNAHCRISVKCKVHGQFLVSCANHYNGRGCPQCAKHGFNKAHRATLYVISSSEGIVKVGITNRTTRDRLLKVAKTSGKEFIVNFELKGAGDFIADVEKQSLQALRQIYKQPEAIFDGSTECFLTTDVQSVISTVLNIAQSNSNI